MPSRRFDQARPFLTLGILVVVWLVAPGAVKAFLRASFFELTAPVTLAASKVRDLQDFWSLRTRSKTELIEAGRDQARINASYEVAAQQTAELKAEIARLEALLRLPARDSYRLEHARVARRDFSAWWQRLVIRKGRDHGIPVGAPVVFSGGVVGELANRVTVESRTMGANERFERLVLACAERFDETRVVDRKRHGSPLHLVGLYLRVSERWVAVRTCASALLP